MGASIYMAGTYENESAGARTQDLRLKRPLLYQLSYTPIGRYIYTTNRTTLQGNSCNTVEKRTEINRRENNTIDFHNAATIIWVWAGT